MSSAQNTKKGGSLELSLPKKFLLVGFDTEYTRLNDNENLCLSYQFYIKDEGTGVEKSYIYYPDIKIEVRLTLLEIFFIIFETMGINDEDISGYYINLICHYGAAEWSMLRDRKEVAKYFEFLYHTLITFDKKDVNFKSRSGVPCNITFNLSDTMLLLPPSHRSLAKASSLLGEEFRKKELTSNEKAHMDKLLRTNKPRFEEYALFDAEITLRLYVELQAILNHINETTNVRYTTIGSATVKHFQKFCRQTFGKGFLASQFPKGNKCESKGYDLARRAYMGGLNSSYYIGELKSEVILDIDFSSAYPTVMNLLQTGSFTLPPPPPEVPFSLGKIA